MWNALIVIPIETLLKVTETINTFTCLKIMNAFFPMMLHKVYGINLYAGMLANRFCFLFHSN